MSRENDANAEGGRSDRGDGSAERLAGRYRLLRELGAGGMGRVFLAFDEAVSDRLALKLLTGPADSETAERFRREVRLARRVTHPNVVRIHDLGEHAGQLYLTMELIDGEDLAALLARQRPLAPARVAGLGAAVARGLAAAHAAAVLHRDLKPSNVLLEQSTGRVVLTDFGVARPLTGAARDGAFDAIRTQGAIGTPAYMAPEQIEGIPLDARCDIYALGVLLFELATGQLPFSGKTPLASALARLDAIEPPDPAEHVALPAGLAALIRSCLERRPEDRPAGAAQLAHRLEQLAAPYDDRSDAGPHDDTLVASGSATPSGISHQASHTGGSSRPRETVRLAVIPFRARGGVDSELSEAVSEALVDVLSATRHLRVIDLAMLGGGSGSDTAPVTRARRVGATAAVHGVVQRRAEGGELRITARLVDAESAEQLWSERFSCSAAGLYEVAESAARKIGEALRLELSAPRHSPTLPAGVAEDYLRARQRERADLGEALGLLERCLARAPGFGSAIAAHASVTVHRYYTPATELAAADRAAAAEASVDRALREAPDHAETHQAAAMLALQRGEVGDAAVAFERALSIAPTYGAALAQLGTLECEALVVEAGLQRLRAAWEIAPSIRTAGALLTTYTLLGDEEDAQWILAEAHRLQIHEHVGLISHRVRRALWTGDLEIVPRLAACLSDRPGDNFLRAYCAQVVGGSSEQRDSLMRSVIDSGRFSPLLLATIHTQHIEAHLVGGDVEAAAAALAQLEPLPFTDLLWLERCRLLAPLRDRPEYGRLRSVTRERTRSVR